MISCYVSIPFGIKTDNSGRELDFDFLYKSVIQPAVQELEIECRRLDEFAPGAIWHKTMFTALISSDLMIADISTYNANVLYELGVRHAMRRGRTLLISAGENLPWNLNYTQVLQYQPDPSGQLIGEPAIRFIEALQAVIRQSQRTIISDSPIYEFFPDLEVILPPELESDYRQLQPRRTQNQRAFAQTVLESPARAISDLKKSEEAVRSAPQSDPIEYLSLLRKYRNLSEWDRVIALADDAPPMIAESPDVRQLHALALNRRRNPGDQERAILILEKLIAETGGDSQTFGILGRIHKDRYEQAKLGNNHYDATCSLNQAIENYLKGFKKNLKDYYPGINAVTLLLQKGDSEARSELEAIIPLVNAAVREKIESGPPDYWDLATDLELAVIMEDWPRAQQTARLAAAQAPSEWMVETTLRNIQVVSESLTNTLDRSLFKDIRDILCPVNAKEEASDDRF